MTPTEISDRTTRKPASATQSTARSVSQITLATTGFGAVGPLPRPEAVRKLLGAA